MTASAFPLDGFVDPVRAARTVSKLHALYVSAGSLPTADEFSSALAGSLRRVPDPDRAVTNLLRFSESTLSASSLFSDLVAYPMLMDVLMKMLSSSQYFADILVRDPELFRWMTTSDALVKARSREFYQEEVQRALRLFQRPEKKLDALRRLYRREILRIGARDILGEADLVTVTAELSHLADALVQAACIIAQQQLAERFPNPPSTPYAVIGLGKLGGCELNYSSDIDILFVYNDEGEIADAHGATRTHHEYFNALVEKIVQNLSLHTAEGHLYRVDLRLRPEGSAGPLARSVASYLLYYETRGELWERQMLIKARPVAGDAAFGESFIRMLEPFVFPRTFFQNPKEYIARIKARIEAAVSGEENVKLRAGGIRDIEFIVQALQLINGGKNKAVRERNTLEALDRLAEANLLTRNERDTLREAYMYFRTVEHRLQTMLNTQTHELPEALEERAILARKLGFDAADELMRVNERFLSSVREIFENVLSVQLDSSSAGILALLDGDMNQHSAAGLLRTYGFTNPQKAAQHLARMVLGSSLVRVRELDVRVREAFRDIAEILLQEIAMTPCPDLTLGNVSVLATSHPFPEQFYAQLKEVKFRKFVFGLCSVSPRLAKGLARYPLLFERLANDPSALATSSVANQYAPESLVNFKNEEELRAAARYVLGIIGFDDVTAELSRLADTVIGATLQQEAAQPEADGRLAIFALGKYGSREMTFDADVDVLFVGAESAAQTMDQLERLARRIVSRLSEVRSEGRLYDVDARLRPEGRNAPLVVEKNAYLTYLSTRASLWERQSLTRLRFVAGDRRLGTGVRRGVEHFVYETPLPPNWTRDIVEMRKRTETRSRARSADFLDIKLGSGGMADVEFLHQMLLMHAGKYEPSLRQQTAVATLEQLLERVGQAAHGSTLLAAYREYRRTETMMRIVLEEKGSVLPTGDQRDILARLMGYESGDHLQRHLAAMMKEVRRIFLHVATVIAQLPTR